MTPRERAEAQQRAASDPRASAFVAASAGSGKTKLLTDRLLRLMLAGCPPERIQCLTFTKAAAAEMALRLQRRLGTWVLLDDPELDAALRALDVTPTETVRERARALFAQVLDLPGGVRIGTIHAFCQSLLRRFPLEASLSPHFELMEDADTALALDAAREDVLGTADPPLQAAIAILAGQITAARFQELLGTLHAAADRLAPVLALPAGMREAALRRACGCTAPDQAALIAASVHWGAEREVRAAAENVACAASDGAAARAQRMLDWLTLDAADRAAHWEEWRCEFLTANGAPRGPTALVNKRLQECAPGLLPILQAEQQRLTTIDDEARALCVVAFSSALLTAAAPMLADIAARKDRGAQLSYDDLIGRTEGLLRDPGVAWVLYKLDGGLDHLLLDEAQDTSPAQWRIARALTDEFFAGVGARERVRTVFAVGDPKQSIYSFQGADRAAFDAARRALRANVEGAGQVWRDLPLDVSFRSAAPVLALVDAVFADPAAAAGVVPPEEALQHFADRATAAGQVELWPLAPLPPDEEPPVWEAPARNLERRSASQALAERLAAWIAQETSGSTMLESRGRPLHPGDVLVLVRRRNAFSRALVRCLKSRGVKVAGLDRMVLTEQPAVQDLMVLGAALLLPEDDLTLAEVLVSPLGGLSDDSLMELAVGRSGTLWEALRARSHERSDWAEARQFFEALLARVDYAAPHALLAEALGPGGGRARLYARLGPEAAEPVDELLAAALTYAEQHPPSLQGFLHWLGHAGGELKREPEGAGDAVRVMTVHGAKGLQAPLVVLPDTTGLPPLEAGLGWTRDADTAADLPLWAPRAEFRCAATEALREAERRRCLEEHNRLLYVALTRAEDRLVVCGWQMRTPLKDECWYAMVARGFARLPGARSAPFGAWDGDRHWLASPQRARVEPSTAPATAAPAPLPAWAGAQPGWRPLPPPPEPDRPQPLAPSRPEGVEHGPVPAAASPLQARQAATQHLERGRVIHALLQHLPDLPMDQRLAAARAFAARPGHRLPATDASTLAHEVLAVLDHPALAPLFGAESRAEVPLTGLIGGRVVAGLVDRLAVLPDRVLIADYKTGRPPQSGVAPVAYLRQMAAYRAVLRAIYPDRPVICALVWTQEPSVALLPDALLDLHDPAATVAA